MNGERHWLADLGEAEALPAVDGLVSVDDYLHSDLWPEQVIVMERAKKYGAAAVFFEAGRNDRAPVAQALVFISNGPPDDPEFAELHKRLWNWGGVPLVYRKTPGLVQLFRCAHKPDFISRDGQLVCKPVKTLKTFGAISADPLWDKTRLRNGTLWDDPAICKAMLKSEKAAHRSLINAVTRLNAGLNEEGILKKHLRRKLLILSLLIAYLEERGAFPTNYFATFLPNATKFFQVLAQGHALVNLLEALEERFNGHVFILSDDDRDALKNSTQLSRFARLIEARQEANGQLTLWQLYSFKDLPIELISHIYQMFVEDSHSSVYTPPFLVRLMLNEALSWERLDRLQLSNEIILDPSCGSGVFLVEAYKRLVLHWRLKNDWKRPGVNVLKGLLKKVHGIDLDPGAVELSAFSLCLALCDSLEPETIRATVKLFPELAGKTIHNDCFFDAKEAGRVKDSIGVIVGNPPFKSKLTTLGAERSYERYETAHGALPDKQLAYLFLHESTEMLADGGVIAMLQQYNFLYNQQSLAFRRRFIETWDVRELLDFVSVRGLFRKDTKVVVIIAEASKPPKNRQILHATFRRSGRVDAEQGFDIDFYDFHWLPRRLALTNDRVWRSNLLGGGRALAFADRLKACRTLAQYALDNNWDYGEGFIEAQKGKRTAAPHITGKAYLPSVALSESRLDEKQITTIKATLFKSAYSARRFTPPMLLIREHMDIPHGVWTKGYLTYSQRIVGYCAPKADTDKLNRINEWLSRANKGLKAYLALTSPSLFIQKATAVQADDLFSLPYPDDETLDLSQNEDILVDDIVNYYRDFIRLGELPDSTAIKKVRLTAFVDVFIRQINAIYKKRPMRALEPQFWPGVVCQPFVFGKGAIDWDGAVELQAKLDTLLQERDSSLCITRIAKLYDGYFVFLLKPDRVRFWLRSIALRDADDTLADLRAQGF